MSTPRERFQLTPNAGALKKILNDAVTGPIMEAALDYALLQLATEMPTNVMPHSPTDPYIGIDANAQMQGARRFVDIFKTLPEPVKPPTPVKPATLHY